MMIHRFNCTHLSATYTHHCQSQLASLKHSIRHSRASRGWCCLAYTSDPTEELPQTRRPSSISIGLARVDEARQIAKICSQVTMHGPLQYTPLADRIALILDYHSVGSQAFEIGLSPTEESSTFAARVSANLVRQVENDVEHQIRTAIFGKREVRGRACGPGTLLSWSHSMHACEPGARMAAALCMT